MLPKCCGSQSEFGDTKRTTKTHDWRWARSNRGVVLTRKKCHNTTHITTSESHMSLESDSDMACASKRRCGTHWSLYPRYYRKQLLSRNKNKSPEDLIRRLQATVMSIQAFGEIDRGIRSSVWKYRAFTRNTLNRLQQPKIFTFEFSTKLLLYTHQNRTRHHISLLRRNERRLVKKCLHSLSQKVQNWSRNAQQLPAWIRKYTRI